MAADSQATTPDAGRGGPNHGLRIFLIWIVLAIVADLLIGSCSRRTCRRATCPRPRTTSRTPST